MSRANNRPGRKECLRLAALCAALLLILIEARPAAPQDMKTISSFLAGRISTSGRRTVAVIDFTDLRGNVTELGRFLAEELSVDLVGNAKGFEVIDRTHLKALLQEHKLASTGLIDPQTARQLGQIAGVDALVTGTITPLGDSVRLSAKVLDTATARMIAASTADVPKTKAIEELLGREIGATQPTTGASTPSISGSGSTQTLTITSVEASDLLIVLKSCRRSGRALSCVGSITNKAEKTRQISLDWSNSYVVDDLDNQYRVDQGNSTFGARGNSQELPGNLAVNFRLLVADASPAASRVTIVLSCYAHGAGGGSFKVGLRNIPLQQR